MKYLGIILALMFVGVGMYKAGWMGVYIAIGSMLAISVYWVMHEDEQIKKARRRHSK